MATYQIWADITKLTTGRYFVTVSAVPAQEQERTQDRTGGVSTGEAATLQDAEALRDELVLELGKTLRQRGHVIVNLFDEAK